jgi:hypothetical protein
MSEPTPPSGPAGASEAPDVMAIARELRAAGVPLGELAAAVREVTGAMGPIGKAVQRHLDAQPEPLWDTEVMAQSAPLWAVNERGSLGYVVGWRWSRPPAVTGSESIPRVHLDPIVVWAGQGRALDHRAVGDQAHGVEVYDRESEARRAAGEHRAKRVERRQQVELHHRARVEREGFPVRGPDDSEAIAHIERQP